MDVPLVLRPQLVDLHRPPCRCATPLTRPMCHRRAHFAIPEKRPESCKAVQMMARVTTPRLCQASHRFRRPVCQSVDAHLGLLRRRARFQLPQCRSATRLIRQACRRRAPIATRRSRKGVKAVRTGVCATTPRLYQAFLHCHRPVCRFVDAHSALRRRRAPLLLHQCRSATHLTRLRCRHRAPIAIRDSHRGRRDAKTRARAITRRRSPEFRRQDCQSAGARTTLLRLVATELRRRADSAMPPIQPIGHHRVSFAIQQRDHRPLETTVV